MKPVGNDVQPDLLTHPDMRMDDQTEGKYAVKDGMRTRAGRCRCANHGNETRAE